jgi:hypothetical protein
LKQADNPYPRLQTPRIKLTTVNPKFREAKFQSTCSIRSAKASLLKLFYYCAAYAIGRGGHLSVTGEASNRKSCQDFRIWQGMLVSL